MKKTSLLLLCLICWAGSCFAQYDQAPVQFPKGNTTGLDLSNFPKIPDITVDQRLDIGSLVVREKKKIMQLSQMKDQLTVKLKTADKKQGKIQEKINEIDNDIKETVEKTNKKASAILTEEQYKVFIEKRDEFVVTQSFMPKYSGGATDF